MRTPLNQGFTNHAAATRVVGGITLSFLLFAQGFAAPPAGKGGGGKGDPSLSLEITPSSFSERSSGVTGIVTRTGADTSVPVTVGLSSSDIGEAAVPINVQIGAGETAAVFAVTAINDGIADGDQSVTVSATATDYIAGSATCTVTDVEGLPLVEYQATYVAMPEPANFRLNDLNDLGMAVGRYFSSTGQHAWLYDPLDDPTTAIDLNDLVIAGFDADNWVIASALGLNNNGLIVGYISLLSDTKQRRGYVLDLAATDADGVPAPRMYDLPDTGHGWTDTYARRVNDRGDILGHYQRSDGTFGFYLVNPGLRAPAAAFLLEKNEKHSFGGTGTPLTALSNPLNEDPLTVVANVQNGQLRQTRGVDHVFYSEVITPFTDAGANPDVNAHGDIASLRETYEDTGKGNKAVRTYTSELFISTASGTNQSLVLPVTVDLPTINSDGTVLLGRSRGDSTDLFFHPYWGVVRLGDLLADPMPTEIYFSALEMNDVSVDGFGKIAAVTNVTNDSAGPTQQFALVILTPVAVTP